MDELNAQGLANMVRAFAATVHLDVALLVALAGAVERRVGVIKAQNLANTVWAFAKISLSNVSLFMVLLRAV